MAGPLREIKIKIAHLTTNLSPNQTTDAEGVCVKKLRFTKAQFYIVTPGRGVRRRGLGLGTPQHSRTLCKRSRARATSSPAARCENKLSRPTALLPIEARAHTLSRVLAPLWIYTRGMRTAGVREALLKCQGR